MEQRTLAHERVLVALDSGEDRVVDAGLAHVIGQQVVGTLRLLRGRAAGVAGAQFTCFTGTKVRILTELHPAAVAGGALARAAAHAQQCTCFTGTKVRILTELHLRLLRVLLLVCSSLLALLVQKYKY